MPGVRESPVRRAVPRAQDVHPEVRVIREQSCKVLADVPPRSEDGDAPTSDHGRNPPRSPRSAKAIAVIASITGTARGTMHGS